MPSERNSLLISGRQMRCIVTLKQMGEYYPSFPFESKRDVTQLPHEIENYSASMVETPRVISSNTSSRTFTVSSAVKIVTLFSTAVRRIS